MAEINMALRKALIEGNAKGLTMKQIADQTGFSYNAIRKQARRMGISDNPGRASRRDEECKPKTTPQYEAWLKAKEGASKTLQELSP